MADERRDVRAKVRTYKDKETGEDKNVYSTVGTAWVSEHGSKIVINLDSVPVGDWDGRLFINKPYEKKEKDTVLNEDEVLDLSEIPF